MLNSGQRPLQNFKESLLMTKKVSAKELADLISIDLLIIDARPTKIFVDGFIAGSINIVFNHIFIQRVKSFFGLAKEFAIIGEANDIDQILAKLDEEKLVAKVYTTSSLEEWKSEGLPLDMIIETDAYELGLDLKHDKKAHVIDVREETDYDLEHITGAINLPLRNFADVLKLSQFDETQNLYLHCNGGTRSVLACSILKKEGFHNIRNIQGGMKAVKEDGQLPLVANKSALN